MSNKPTPPITVDDHGDLEVYSDVESACGDLEIYDVDRLAIFDSLGARLRAETRAYSVMDLVIEEGIEPAPSELRDKLRQYVRRVGPERVGLADYEDAPLDLLLDALLRFFGTEPKHERGLSAWLDGIRRMIRGR